MRHRAILALALALVAAAPARADKTIAVTVDPWHFHAGLVQANWTDPGFDDHAWGGPAPAPFWP